MTIPAVTIDETGIHAPGFQDILDAVKDEFRSIYGADIYLENDSQDGQLVGIFALAIHNANSQTVAAYNAFSPSTAQGAGLSSVVKINGIKRKTASFSSADVLITGQTGTIIANGVATDVLSQRWLLPATVIIPPSGEITVTATAENIGAIRAQSGTITSIATPTRGWQSITNPLAAIEGAPIETDAELRRRQTFSTALPSRTILDGLIGGVLSIDGVARLAAYENDTNLTDINGLPPHSVSLVVEGGDATAIAQEIDLRKGIGAATYGTTSVRVQNVYGLSNTINFYRPTEVPITVVFTLKAFPGYTVLIDAAIKQAIVDYINDIEIGGDVYISRIIAAAMCKISSKTYEILPNTTEIARDGNPVAPSDIVIAFNEAAFCEIANITITVVT